MLLKSLNWKRKKIIKLFTNTEILVDKNNKFCFIRFWLKLCVFPKIHEFISRCKLLFYFNFRLLFVIMFFFSNTARFIIPFRYSLYKKRNNNWENWAGSSKTCYFISNSRKCSYQNDGQITMWMNELSDRKQGKIPGCYALFHRPYLNMTTHMGRRCKIWNFPPALSSSFHHFPVPGWMGERTET